MQAMRLGIGWQKEPLRVDPDGLVVDDPGLGRRL
jgi:hypothetical protein